MSVLLGSPRPCSREAAELGEGPRWDAARGELLWVDILAGTLRRAVPDAGGMLRTVGEQRLDVPLGAAAPRADGDGWIVAAGEGVALLSLRGDLRWLARPERRSARPTRMNDACCDPAGRLWAGSMAYDESSGAGSLYRVDPDGACHVILTGVTISNGLGWSRDGATQYYVDTPTGRVDAFAFNPASGTISDRRVFARVEGGGPDGLTVDDEGFVWVAVWGAGELRRFDPDGREDEVVSIPVAQVSSCCFGGADRRTLFITTARHGMSPAQLAAEPDAGRVFAARTRVSGPPATAFAGS